MAEFTYSQMKTKYEDFRTPEVQVLINGNQLTGKVPKIKAVSEVKVELTSGYESGFASFLIYNVFDFQNDCFDFDSFENSLQLGKSVVIFLGYSQKVEPVFRGYIAGLRFVVDKEKGQYIEVTAMDVKGQMMANNYAKKLKGIKYSACVNEILHQDLYEPILGGAFTVDPTPEPALKQDGKDRRSLDMVEESDYEFVVKAAKKFAYDFYSDGDFLYFRQSKSHTSVLAALELGKGIMFSSMEFSLTGMVNEIEARSSDPSKGKSFSKVLTLTGKYNTKGNDGGKLLSKSRKVYIDPTIDSKETANIRAKALLEQMKYRFSNLEAECVGIPELRPGRFVEISGLQKNKPITYYIDSVVHSFRSDGGYTTQLKGRATEFPT